MRYFFLIYALVAMLVLLVFPVRGGFFKETPREVFPDMDHQDKVRGQRASTFFTDGMGARKPVKGTLPQGYQIADGSSDEIPQFSFANGPEGVFTGRVDGKEYLKAIPTKELGINTDGEAREFVLRGKERFDINCSACHGLTGDGKGTVALRGFPAVANLLDASKHAEKYADGKVYETIVKGAGLMPSLGHKISIRDRWAIVAYLRSLQEASKKAAQ